VTWTVLALAAGFASAVNVWASKGLVAHVRPAVLGGTVHLMGGLMCLALLGVFGADLAPAAERLPHLALMTAVYVAGNTLYFRALAASQLSEVDLLLRSSALWTVIGGVALLREPFGLPSLAGGVLILVSVTLLARAPGRWRFSAPQRLALGAAMLFGAGNVIDKAIAAPFHPLGYTALNLVLTGVGMLAIARPRRAEWLAPALWRPSAWLVAATFALTQLCIILAFAAGGTAGDVILVAQARLLLLVAVGVIVLRERDRLGRKLGAVTLMLVGIAFLSADGAA
jgi:drug/metabolite transporter (DMT)-like permease